MADDDLTRAAARAREVLPGPIARLVEDELRRGIAGAAYQWHEPYAPLAAAVLALPVSVPDRGYGELICHRCSVQAAFCPCERPDVRTPVTAEQIEQAAQAAAEADMQHEFELDNAHYIAGNNRSAPVEPETWDALCESDRDDYRGMARAAVEALGLSVVEGGEPGE